AAGQGNLFGGVSEFTGPEPDPHLPPWPERERLSHEKQALGLYLTGNPLSEYKEELSRFRLAEISALKEAGGAEGPGPVKVGGLVTQLRRTKIKSGVNAGRFMGRFVLEDLTGSIPVAVFAAKLQQFGHLLEDEAVVVLQGFLKERGSDLEMTADEITGVTRAADRVLSVDLTLPGGLSSQELFQLRDLLIEHPGETPVRLHYRLPGQTVQIAPRADLCIELNSQLASTLEEMLGAGCVQERRLA
ncbi:MAG: hypothetical protein KDD47_21600, partial [Acidobacteria bacterium]|nr:hypothetical protein [Acidobacteriota bacterium]